MVTIKLNEAYLDRSVKIRLNKIKNLNFFYRSLLSLELTWLLVGTAVVTPVSSVAGWICCRLERERREGAGVDVALAMLLLEELDAAAIVVRWSWQLPWLSSPVCSSERRWEERGE
ncbi:hypothetical protein AABB24_023534 [Solanum stoloniferum]|uniref:Uncharacterized protein n=1 Tax=Solanum stoloniferum TaxID=62892 RepID=A0ABD2SJY0_9SOLN